MKFSEMKPKQLKEAREELKKRTSFFKVSRVILLNGGGVMLEGGKFPVIYDSLAREITLWGRANRETGYPIKIEELQRLEDIIFSFFAEHREYGET